MKYLKSYKIFEDITGWSTTDKFEERDLTNNDTYLEIKNQFGISPEDLGFILLEFIDEYNLRYKCSSLDSTVTDLEEFIVRFYKPDSFSGIREWMERKIGHGHIWDWNMLSEMESRLNQHGLTIKENGIYQIFLNNYQLQLLIRKSS